MRIIKVCNLKKDILTQENTNIMTTAKNNTNQIIELTERFLTGQITQDQFNTEVLILEKA